MSKNKPIVCALLALHLCLFVFSGSLHAFDESDLRRVIDGDKNLSGVDLRGVDLREFDLRGVNLSGAYLLYAKLGGANLSRANLSDANLNGADLNRADLRGADLSGALLGFAKLHYANLAGAGLRGANFYKAYFYETNLDGADLTGANFNGAYGLSSHSDDDMSADIADDGNLSDEEVSLLEKGDYVTTVNDTPGDRMVLTSHGFIIEIDAIYSAVSSGLGMGLINQQLIRGAPNAALRGLNNRLFRARAGMQSKPVALASTLGGDSSLLRYLSFMQDEHTSYKVALGLADGVERSIELNLVDTLSAQAGSNFKGQSLNGGLPYAMMGGALIPMAGGTATVHIVEAEASGKTVIDDAKSVVEAAPWKRWEVFVAGDFSHYDQDVLDEMLEGFDTQTYAGSVGIEYRAKEWLNLGLAWTYLESDADASGGLGDIELDGNLISTYATAFWGQNWADILYSYGSFNSDIHRNTGFLGGKARGDTDSDSHNVRLNFGRNIQVGNNIVTGPIAGLRYTNGNVDPYSETGGGLAALNYSDTDFESMQSQVGWQASHVRATGWGRIISQVHLAWEHEYMPENGMVGISMQTSPFSLGGRRVGGFSAESDGDPTGTDWMSAGAGLRFEIDNGWALLTDYEGAFFRSSSSQHYASVKLSYEW